MRLLKQIALLVAGLVLATLVTEGVLRLGEVGPLWRVAPLSEVSLYGADAEAGYTHRPLARGVWLTENRAMQQVNAAGFLDRDFTQAKPEGVYRIAVFGDSLTEALQVDQSQRFTGLLEEKFRQAGKQVEVMNFGLAGATPAVMAARIDRFVPRYHPDLILIMADMSFLSPLAMDDSVFTAYRLGASGEPLRSVRFRDTLSYRMRTGLVGEAIYFLMDHSRVARVINNRKNVGLFSELSKPNMPDGALAPSVCGDAPEQRKLMEMGQPVDDWKRTAAMYNDIARTSLAAQAKVILTVSGLSTICPTARTALVSALAERVGSLGSSLTSTDLDAELVRHLDQAGSLADLRGFGASTGRGHLNARGHEVYAATLYDMLGAAQIPILRGQE